MSTQPTLAFIGAGNMARAIIGGLLNSGYPAASIWATATRTESLADLSEQGLQTTTDNQAACAAADIVVLAVKPQILKGVAQSLADTVQASQPLIVSVAAGIRCDSMDTWLGGNTAIVRCMPNTPSLVQTGASGLFANDKVTAEQKQQTEAILKTIGLALWVQQETELSAVTAVSGSGPAYYFYVMEAMAAAGEKLGLSPEVARELTLQTALGAAKMASQSDVDAAELRRRVTSPKGTTEQAIMSFERQGLEDMFSTAMQACYDRAEEMAEELAK
ncbi:pyrroline-5-carboxylate reductase [Aliamphritea spongicola]|uniref:pyrroline-5-carboxylate reductase n=1 Tax=Aliamphritea spongicola TaxID=707589 RepID=UPI00196AF662|nr:pyrroline-5-carboxylate reductase [Aliamphritea spongicola]MBN3562346.1 pyrroline-5-carboxylate reductase [Aliamphritea spongicola]